VRRRRTRAARLVGGRSRTAPCCCFHEARAD
jgi:hypothetical protein